MLKLNSNKKSESAFTLVELLVVIVILGVLSTIGLVAFASAQARGRDAARKSDLKQIASALELYFSDYGKYPSSSSGKIKGCPTTTSTSCVWGAGDSTSTLTDGKTVYFETLPTDPSKSYNYYYRSASPNQSFQLYARLENLQDPDIISTSYSCGTGITCNFAITSPNTTP